MRKGRKARGGRASGKGQRGKKKASGAEGPEDDAKHAKAKRVYVNVNENGNRYAHGGGGEVRVLVLELAVEREALLVAVVAQQRRHLVHLTPASLVRADREALPAEHEHQHMYSTVYALSMRATILYIRI